MPRVSLPLTRLIHENLSIVMCFAYSQEPLSRLMKERFCPGWKYLDKAFFEMSAERAERACLELALFLRMLDEEEKLSAYFKKLNRGWSCGKLIRRNGSEDDLTFREVANKVIHSSRLEWKFAQSSDPTLICHTQNKEKWLRAEVDIVALAALCGGLMS